MEARQAKALHIAAVNRLEANNGHWRVPSQTGDGNYMVVVGRDEAFHCSCPDYEERLSPCKHIMAIEITIRRETGKDPKVSFSETVKVTYSQDWKAYNAAKTNEKDMFVRLLADLCRSVPQPEQRTGRPRLPMSDMAFACIFKTYSRFPSRRLCPDLRTMADAGYIDAAPSFNSLSNYMRSPAMEAALHQLIQLSALPLAAIETDFAVDSSGFGTANLKTWFSQKHGREITHREWVKVHAMCGVRTHIVTAADVTDSTVNDSPMLPGLVTATAKNFEIAEVSADKGYSSKNNAAEIESHGGVPFIAFKSNAVEPVPGSAWARMYHQFAYNRDDYLSHYHKRSNVETVFSMVKAKTGDSLLSKSMAGYRTEALAKFVAHNLCCLIQSFYELGVEPCFDQVA